jgi:hypothetical protein
MLELYHGLVSTASERIRLVLEEKGLPWTSYPVDLFNGEQHRPAYRAVNRMGQVPTLVHDRFALRARLWNKTIDEVHPFTGVLTYAIAFRPALIQKPKRRARGPGRGDR